ncbi:MobV family relaxase [Faecalibaculum rodentium]|uniref:MobV family relaxase n=1 Tax=Faecalibaculum rodentium TaxID=1702221 RepID=UPI0025B77466|nr:MobV family relaxase [Faecalibaculum rodentium]
MSHYTVCHYEKCYGPPVSYSTHIERKKADGTEHVPYNIKRRDLTRHNKEFIKEAREIGRSAAIEKRLDAVRHQKDADGNEYERKIRKGQICCIEIRMSASVEGMAEIIEQGRLMEWCRESIKWAQKEHGKENIVSAVLHMDEETPHLHVSLVPVVSGESKKQRTTKKRAAKDKEKAENNGEEVPKKKRRYKKKATVETLRLCADDVMTQWDLKRRQTEYAVAMAPFGLERGEEGSPAKHKDLAQYYKEQYELQRGRLDELLKELAGQEDLVKEKNREILKKDSQIREQEKELNETRSELTEKKNEIARQQQQLDKLLPLIVKAQDRLDTYTEAGEYAEGRIESADRLLQAADSREKEVAKVEKEALERINNASISFLAKKEVERLAKENAELKLLVSGNATALEREAAATRHEKAGREKGERELQQLKETVSVSQTALERRHPLEARLIRELVSIEIKDPDYQDAILSGQTLTWKKYPFMDPATGKRIPEEYADNISVRIEGHGEDSFISMCGKRISDFFRDIWAKVKAALGIKQRQEEEKRKQQTQKPDTGQTQEQPRKSRGIRR